MTESPPKRFEELQHFQIWKLECLTVIKQYTLDVPGMGIGDDFGSTKENEMRSGISLRVAEQLETFPFTGLEHGTPLSICNLYN